MSVTTQKLSEGIAVSAIATWVPMAGYRQVTVAVSTATAEIQIKQATSAAGAGAKVLGAATTATKFTVTAAEMDLANDFAYVSATVTESVSPDVEEAVLIRSDGRFSE